MRKAFICSFAALAVSASFALLGCGKSPDAVCKKIAEIDKDDDDKQKPEECVKDMEELKKASPKGYDCIAKCTDMGSKEGFGICMLGCYGSHKDLEEHFDKKSKEEQAQRDKEEGDKLVAFAKKGDKKFEGTLKDFSDKEAKYAITLVEGFKEDDGGGGFMKVYELDTGDKFGGGPRVTVSFGSEETMESALELSEAMKDKVTKKDKTDGGWTIHSESEYSLTVQTQSKADDKFWKCRASMSSSGAVAKKDELLPWLDKMCKSLKPS